MRKDRDGVPPGHSDARARMLGVWAVASAGSERVSRQGEHASAPAARPSSGGLPDGPSPGGPSPGGSPRIRPGISSGGAFGGAAGWLVALAGVALAAVGLVLAGGLAFLDPRRPPASTPKSAPTTTPGVVPPYGTVGGIPEELLTRRRPPAPSGKGTPDAARAEGASTGSAPAGTSSGADSTSPARNRPAAAGAASGGASDTRERAPVSARRVKPRADMPLRSTTSPAASDGSAGAGADHRDAAGAEAAAGAASGAASGAERAGQAKSRPSGADTIDVRIRVKLPK